MQNIAHHHDWYDVVWFNNWPLWCPNKPCILTVVAPPLDPGCAATLWCSRLRSVSSGAGSIVCTSEPGTTKKAVAGGLLSLDPEKWPALQRVSNADADAYLQAEVAATTDLIEALLEHREVC
jgi:hypothetical protein